MTDLHDDNLLKHVENVRGKVLLITGGANGLGRATALTFAKHGCRVVIGDLDVQAGEQTVREIENLGSKAVFSKCDVTDWDDQLKLFDVAEKTFGVIDYVIPNAGVNEIGNFCVGPLEQSVPTKPILKTLDVNLNGVLYTTRLGQYYLYKNRHSKGRALVFIGSMAGNIGLPHGELYSASKHALLGLCRSLCRDLQGQGIRTGIITPWFADTAILPIGIKYLLAGVPLASVDRIVGAITLACTDPDMSTTGSMYSIPDHGTVVQIPKHELSYGVYKALNDRGGRLTYVRDGIVTWVNTIRDVISLLCLGAFSSAVAPKPKHD